MVVIVIHVGVFSSPLQVLVLNWLYNDGLLSKSDRIQSFITVFIKLRQKALSGPICIQIKIFILFLLTCFIISFIFMDLKCYLPLTFSGQNIESIAYFSVMLYSQISDQSLPIGCHHNITQISQVMKVYTLYLLQTAIIHISLRTAEIWI
jgi:hypothetical protein